MTNTCLTLAGYIHLHFELEFVTGCHIGGGQSNLAIGVVDKTVIRDPLTKQPIIPGSSIKGKIRNLLARQLDYENDTIRTDKTKSYDNDASEICKLFGDTDKHKIARLLFQDAKLTEKSEKVLNQAELDLPYTEVKFENAINRLSSVANPRQIERVPAGAVFDVCITYKVLSPEDNQSVTFESIEEDITLLQKGIDLLEQDYLGGHGSRGYGRVRLALKKIDAKAQANNFQLTSEEQSQLEGLFS
jgi:CRISPR-associated protein Csm3